MSVAVLLVGIATPLASGAAMRHRPVLADGDVPVLLRGGLRFRDLDRDGRLSPFEDWRKTPEARAADLATHMTLAEKAGVMVHDAAPLAANGQSYDPAAAGALIRDGHVVTLISRLAASGRVLAEQNNALQRIAAGARIAIPLTISTDPRHHFQVLDGASVAGTGFSKWPEATGFGAPGFRAEGLRAQSRALVVLKADGVRIAPGTRIYLVGVDPAVARAQGLIPVARPEEAERALVRMTAPWRGEHTQYFYGAKQHEGSLAWAADDPALTAFRAVAAKVPTTAVVYLDRPAILTPLVPLAKGLIGEFGASDAALLDALMGRVPPEGRLPFELPSSEAAVAAQAGDLPHDSRAPLFPIGYGLTLAGAPLRPSQGS
ncbi:hypothetical protein ACQHGV_04115 [Sphingomonas pseudosanguinis]|uniref:hypothetical protein n=1 Tax=Sphingomonas pseudosanguinis TaxID=413712 RepID=UPI003F856EFB